MARANPLSREQKGGLKLFQAHIHPEVQKRLRIAAIEDDMSIPEKLHSILCHEFGLEHLQLHNPEPSAAGQ